MAAALVNTTTGSADGAASTIAAAAQNHSAGNILIALVVWSHASRTLNSISDTDGNTWTRVTGSKADAGSDNSEIFVAHNIGGHATNVVTATFSGTVSFRRIAVMQYSGVLTASAVDDADQLTGSGTHETTPALTTTTPGVILGVAGGDTTGSNNVADSGYTLQVSGLGADTYVVDRITGASGSYTPGFTHSNSRNWWMSSVALKEASSGTEIFGAVSAAFTDGIVAAGKKDAKAASASPLTTARTVAGKKNANAATSVPIALGVTTASKKNANATVDDPITLTFVTDGQVAGARGAVIFTGTFGVSTSAKKNANAAVDDPTTLNRTTAGKKNAQAATTLPITTTITTSAKKNAHAQISTVETLSFTVTGKSTAYGASTTPILLTVTTRGDAGGTVSGQVVFASSFGVTTTAKKDAHAALTLPVSVDRTVVSTKNAHARLALPSVFSVTTIGSRNAHGRSTLPITVTYTIDGFVGSPGDPPITSRTGATTGRGKTSLTTGSGRTKATGGTGETNA